MSGQVTGENKGWKDDLECIGSCPGSVRQPIWEWGSHVGAALPVDEKLEPAICQLPFLPKNGHRHLGGYYQLMPLKEALQDLLFKRLQALPARLLPKNILYRQS